MLETSFDITAFIPQSFTKKYCLDLCSDRKYHLDSVLSALLLIQIFPIPTTALLTLFFLYATEIIGFCGFYESISDELFFSKFKTKIDKEIAALFESIAIKVIDICIDIDDTLPNYSSYKDLYFNLIYDTSGLNHKVKENNPRTIASEINRQKTYTKATK